MNSAMHIELQVVARGLEIFGPLPAAELITHLVGELTEKEAWDVIVEAERIGMIERDEMVFEPLTPSEQEWRLVKGFDVKKLEIPA